MTVISDGRGWGILGWFEHAFITTDVTIKDIFTTSKTNAMIKSPNEAVCNTIMSCLTGKISFLVAHKGVSSCGEIVRLSRFG